MERKYRVIKIDGKDFEYEKIHLSWDAVSPMSAEIAKELLLKTKKAFDNHGLKMFLAFGTLLGAVRDNNFIPDDYDIDVYVDDEEKLLHLIPELYEHKIKLCRHVKGGYFFTKGGYYSFMYKESVYIDVYILQPFNFSIVGLWCFHLGVCAVPKKYFRITQEIKFLGNTFYCPSPPENLLHFWYGDTWRIPQSGHDFHYDIYLFAQYKKVKSWLNKKLPFVKKTLIHLKIIEISE
jgi:hypothetical protein